MTSGEQVVVADPDRDRLSFVGLSEGSEPIHTALEVGDEPGRLAEDSAGRVHVALRGSGQLATVDPTTHAVLARRNVCSSPRGIAYQASTDVVHVACADGAFVTLPADPTPSVSGAFAQARVRQLGADLRDVAVVGDSVYVSRFRSAELLRLDADGQIQERTAPRTISADTFVGASMRRMKPNVAWRMLALQTTAGDGEVVVLHQRSSEDEVGPRELSAETNDSTIAAPTAYYGSAAPSPLERCDGAVHTTFTEFSAGAQESLDSGRGTAPFGNLALAVDIAVSERGDVAIVNAGALDPETKVRDNTVLAGASQRFVPDSNGLVTSVALTSLDEARSGDYGRIASCASYESVALDGQFTSATFAGENLVLQRREPAALVVMQRGLQQYTIDLGGHSVLDSGHEIFHRDPGGGIACAACHPEGTEDGHVWDFAEFDPRRTQALNLNLADTAPYHWAGDVDDMEGLVDEVMVTRMGATYQSEERTAALRDWLFALEPPPPGILRDAALVDHGRELFQDASVGCASCHSGPRFTDNTSRDVGTGEVVQVPSLLGLSRRAPYMRTGCATTLEARFTEACGGTAHGNVGTLDEADLHALAAYLRSL